MNKNNSLWVNRPRVIQPTVNRPRRGGQTGTKGAVNRPNTKETKERVTKNTIETQSVSHEIVAVIDSFSEVNSSFKKWYGNTTQRAAISRLLAEHGLEQALRVIKLLPQTNARSYFPSINNPIQLEDKWSQLENALKRKKQELTSKKPIFI